jgi:hypothetical protein
MPPPLFAHAGPRQVRRQNLRRNDKNAIAFGIDKNFVNITAGFKTRAACRLPQRKPRVLPA